MVAAKILLDPTARDPNLRAFAYLQARFVKGARSAIDCLQPFVLFALAQLDGKAYEPELVIGFLADNYQLSIPRYMLEDMVPSMIRLGALKRQDIANIVTCHNVIKDEPGSGSDLDFSLDQISEAEEALVAFARREGNEKPFSSTNWGEALIKFFLADTAGQESKSATVEGLLVSDTAYFDNKIVANFVIEAHKNGSSVYQTIEKIFYGVLVSEFLVRIENTGNKAEYSGLNVIYDTTVLLRILGTSGNYLRTATLEMHEVLQDLGCQTYYYNHNYSELLNVLDYIVQAYGTDAPMNAETQQAFEAGEVTVGKVAMLFTGPDVALGALGITEHPETYEDRKQDEFQINERDFADELRRKGKYRAGTAAPDYDAKSLGLTMRLRRGKTTRNVASAQAIMVTHNPLFAHRSRRHLIQEGILSPRAIGPVLTVGQMTTVGWLANEIVYEPKRVSKELIANCYRASLPMDGWSSAFWDAMKEANPATAEQITNNALLVSSVQEIAQQETKGHIGLIKKLNLNDVLTQAEKKSAELEEQARSTGRNEGRDKTLASITSSAEVRAVKLAGDIARGAEITLFCICLMFLFLSFVLGDFVGSIIWFLVNTVLFALAAVSIMDIFRVKIPFSFRVAIERQALKLIRRTQSYVGARPPS
jgi:hypothetical protein